MNKSILSISVFSLLLFTCFISACKKPRRPEDPCKNKVAVTATTGNEYQWGHFRMRNADQTETYLFATNWDEYASRVVPGARYKIGYKEVTCVDCGDKMTMGNGIREGGCVLYPRKCIMITCLEENKQSCLETILYPPDFANVYSQAVNSQGISGNSLDVTVGFSGCSQDDVVKFELYAEQLPTTMLNPANSVWLVKAVNKNTEFTCDAYFTKRVCFDLTPIRDAGKNLNQTEALIRLVINGTETDFTYKF